MKLNYERVIEKKTYLCIDRYKTYNTSVDFLCLLGSN